MMSFAFMSDGLLCLIFIEHVVKAKSVVKINYLHKIKEERKRSNIQIKNTRIYVVR